MFKKRGQGLSITVIVAAVIGLIIIVVIIAILTGKLGAFSKGIDETNTCANACKAIGKTTGTGIPENVNCGGTKLPGTYKEGGNCCCT